MFKKVCEAKVGNMTLIAKSFDVERCTVYEWVKKDARFQKCVDDIRESIVDLAESQLTTLMKGIPKIEENDNGEKTQVGWIERPSEAAIIFKLKTQGKDRGYVERVQTEEVNNPFFELMRRAGDAGKEES